MDASDPTGPKISGSSVINHIDISSVTFETTAGNEHEVIVSSSARAGAYAKCGWTTTCLSAEHPWTTENATAQKDSCPSTSDCSTAFVTGRYVYSTCQIKLASKPCPSPEFQKAVEYALNVEDSRRRSTELERVFHQFGHFYSTSVELGGMKQMTCTRQTSAQVSLAFPAGVDVAERTTAEQ